MTAGDNAPQQRTQQGGGHEQAQAEPRLEDAPNNATVSAQAPLPLRLHH